MGGVEGPWRTTHRGGSPQGKHRRPVDSERVWGEESDAVGGRQLRRGMVIDSTTRGTQTTKGNTHTTLGTTVQAHSPCS